MAFDRTTSKTPAWAKSAVVLISAITGGWMVIDGTHVLIKGKYLGPDRPGPWASIFELIGIDPLSAGPLFVILGVVWIAWGTHIMLAGKMSFKGGSLLSVLTLWYLPIGSALALLHLLILAKHKKSTEKN